MGAVLAALLGPVALHPSDATVPSRFIPSDLIPYAVDECMKVIPEAERYFTVFPLDWNLSPGGQLRTVVGNYVMEELESGGYATTDETVPNLEASALVNDCLREWLFEQEHELREPTAAEILVLHDWVRTVQQPCLAARGVSALPLSYSTLMDPNQYPWRMPELPGADFDTRLELRRACPPMPEYLHDDGIFTY